ncbi:ribonuclease P protein component [Lacinutrix salivirga]
MNYTFGKQEKLKHKKEIDRLFAAGKSLSAYPLKLIYTETDTNLKVGVSVSKRHFKSAVHRNRIKRLLREGYRLNKNELLNNKPLSFSLMILYISKEMPDFETIDLKMKQLITKFNTTITK